MSKSEITRWRRFAHRGRVLSAVVGILVVAGAILSEGSEAGAANQRSSSSPNDRFFDEQWGLSRIQAPEAWRIANGSGAVIAVVDSGVDLGHPDLKSKLVVYRDANMVDPRSPSGPDDHSFRGTQVAGIAAAVTNNRIGIAGTAPRARILPVRVTDDNATAEETMAWIAAGIRYAADKRADVINLPHGPADGRRRLVISPSPEERELQDAIGYAWEKGAVIVGPAGNSYFPLCNQPPAGSRVLCVGATQPDDSKLLSSDYDATMMQDYLVAPGGTGSCGGSILSTWPRGYLYSFCSPAFGYGALAESVFAPMAAPFVSGVAALLAGQGLTNEEIVERLISTAEDLGLPGRDPIYGFGMVNALRAVNGG